MDTAQTLHIRCGSDIRQTLEDAGFQGAYLDFSDPFCQGPVLELPSEDFIASRQAFISRAYGLPEADVTKAQRLRYARLANACAHDHIVLWFEHDSYDQLILAYLLKHFSQLDERPRIDLICIDDFPVKPRFMGLGQLSPEQLAGLWPARQTIGSEQFKLGAEVWSALTEPTPHNLVRIIQRGTPAVFPMAAALKRHLQELPARQSGLSLTEELTLGLLKERGCLTGGALFKALNLETEPLPYLGDLMYWYDLARLIAGDAVATESRAIMPDREMALTALGEACLAGERDWMASVKTERYVGGIRVAPDGSKVWRRQG